MKPAGRVIPPSRTTFADALSVPQLAQECSEVVKLHGYRKSTGVKVLREVSKQISAVMLADVRGYTLQLEESEQPELLEAAGLLQHTQLSRLRVKVMAGTGVLRAGRPVGACMHAARWAGRQAGKAERTEKTEKAGKAGKAGTGLTLLGV